METVTKTLGVKELHTDRVSRDVLAKLFRYLSARPRHVHWQNEVSAVDVVSILKCGGSLAACARNEFTSLSTFSDVRNISALYVNVNQGDGAALFDYLFGELAPTLEVLSISSPIAFSIGHFERCRSLRYLRLPYSAEPWILRRFLEASSGNLRTLAVGGDVLDERAANAIADHCQGLQNLELDYGHVTGVLRRVWETVGPTLEDLSMDMRMLDSGSWVTWIAEIAANCGRVASFEYPGMRINWALLVLLCEKFGRQLKSIRFHNVTPSPSHADVNKIMDACPDLRIDATSGFEQPEMFAAFRDRLRVASIRDSFRGDMRAVGDAVPSLEELSMIVFDVRHCRSFVSDFFYSPKHALKSLHLMTVHTPLIHDDNPLDVLAERVASLEILTISATRIATRVFRNIAEANSQLKTVSISCWMTDQEQIEAESAAVSVVEDLAQCRLLRELLFVSASVPPRSARIAEACVLFRGRNVDIFIGDTQYES